ncbi:hypothetical protein ACJIZ3_020209 [Penstemon smallii]|uniref:Homeobox-leucine zipper protein n=1 Tax=Penstemon smallii TaxID=265156 RepID=A0ABD3SHY4_9LAMI
MEGSSIYDNSHMTNVLLLKNETIPSTSQLLDSSLWLPNSSPSFHGSASMVNFEENKSERPLFTQIDTKLENFSEEFDGFNQPEKKRRLLPDQVRFLEKSFEVDNKLEPERKVQLAKELGLQPRQVAIWFQNRRARYKTRLLEKEYDSLKSSYDKLKEDCASLFKDNEKLKNEVHLLNEKLLMRKNGNPISKPFEPIISPLDAQSKKPISSSSNAAKSDVSDPDGSPNYTDGNDDSSHVFEPEASDFSQDEDDSLCFPKLEVECCDDLQPNSCNLGFPVQDQGTWFWQY